MIGSLRTFQRRLIDWYHQHRRDLPWRVPRGRDADATPDPYHVLLSEAMLQQTQVATVIPYFHRFIQRYPTLGALAQADLQEVLRLWQGLGYYSRARNLHACAQRVVEDHQGRIPDNVESLLALPGVGRYTAGAIASLAYNVQAPILDGNVTRVLCRIDRIESDPRDKEIQKLLWKRAEALLPARHPSVLNSALMELGATVCTPRNPQCLICPVKAHCEGAAAGVQERIPLVKRTKPTPLHHRTVVCIEHQGRYLIEQRPARGRWGGLWQFMTIEADNGAMPGGEDLSRRLGIPLRRVARLGQVRHALTHRRYEFQAYTARLSGKPRPGQTWVTPDGLDAYPLSKPQLRIAAMLASGQR